MARSGIINIESEWAGHDVFIIGGGVTVGRQPVHRLEGRKVIAINSSYEIAPFAQVIFFGDNRWYLQHRGTKAFMQHGGRKITCSDPATGDQIEHVRRVIPTKECGLCTRRDSVASQKTSFQGAMNLAYHFGAKRIILLGADFCRAVDGRTHHHKPHIWKNSPGNQTWDKQFEQFQFIVEPLRRAGIPVINTSLESRLKYWPVRTLEEILK